MAEGEAKGRESGEQQFAELTRYLLEAGRLEDLAKAAAEPEYRSQLYREMGSSCP